MPLYSYVAINHQGTRIQGTIDAANVESAHNALTELKLTPIEVLLISYDSSSGDAATREGRSVPKDPSPQEEDDPIKETQPEQPKIPEPVSFAIPESEQIVQELTKDVEKDKKTYYPITDTLRLYAGWQLAIYALVYVLSYYQLNRNLSFEIPYINGILYSPLVFSFTFASFLFLLCTSIHRLLGRGLLKGLILLLLGIIAFILLRMNVA